MDKKIIGLEDNKEDEDNTIITFNVGGKLFHTTLNTLAKYKDSLLYKLATTKIGTLKDKDGNIFIDRNPEYFEYILDCHRTYNVILQIPRTTNLNRLTIDCDYYQIPNLMNEQLINPIVTVTLDHHIYLDKKSMFKFLDNGYCHIIGTVQIVNEIFKITMLISNTNYNNSYSKCECGDYHRNDMFQVELYHHNKKYELILNVPYRELFKNLKINGTAELISNIFNVLLKHYNCTIYGYMFKN